MNQFTASLILVILVILTLPIFFITIPVLLFYYNKMIKRKNSIDYCYGGIDVMLKKRADIIPNLVASVQKVMNHESELLERITKLRTEIKEQKEIGKERFSKENQMSQLLGDLTMTMENYPELKSNKNMLHLQRTLNESEEQISASRRAYNAAVVAYNNGVTTIPSNLIAGVLNYKERPYFEASAAEKILPNVSKLFA